MKTLNLKLSAIAIAAAAVTGCQAPTKFSEQEAVQVGEYMAQEVEGTAENFDLSGDETEPDYRAGRINEPALHLSKLRRIVRRFRRSLLLRGATAPPCESGSITFSGKPDEDVDMDNIPDDFKVTFEDCALSGELRHGARRVVINGSMNVMDNDLEGPTFNFMFAHDNLSISAEGPRGTLEFTEDGTIIGSMREATYAVDIEGSRKVIANPRYGDSHEFGASLNWSAAYLPYSDWTPGERPVKGAISINGSHEAYHNGKVLAATLKTLPTVTVDPACETDSHIVEGSTKVTHEDPRSSAEIFATWSDCGQVEVRRATPANSDEE